MYDESSCSPVRRWADETFGAAVVLPFTALHLCHLYICFDICFEDIMSDDLEAARESAERETIETWDKCAALYQERFMDLTLYDESYCAFLSLLAATFADRESQASDTQHLLDVGCGPGVIAKYVLANAAAHGLHRIHLTGADAAPSMIELAQKQFPEATWLTINARDLRSSFAPGHFAGVVVGFCVPYIDDAGVDRLFADLAQLLKTHGLLYVSFVVGDRAQSGFKSNKKGDRALFFYRDADDVSRRLRDNGFTVEKTVNVHYPQQDEVHCAIIARRSGAEAAGGDGVSD